MYNICAFRARFEGARKGAKMKGKKLLTLLSIFAGAAVVGTTFAAWAVTDNADPFGIKVTPGSSSEDNTKMVTLSYGDQFMAENLTGLTAEKAKVAAKVGLKATTAGDTYTGKFTMTLEDLSGKEDTDVKLIDHLRVELYNQNDAGVIEYNASSKEVITDLTEKTPDGFIPTEGDLLTFSKSYAVPNGTEKIVYVLVKLEAGLSPAVLDQIHNDHVRITMDWGKGSAEDAEASRLYFTGTVGTPYYAYAWTATGAKNHDWPGVLMVQDADSDPGVFAIDLGTQFTHVIFTDNNGYQTTDLELSNAIRANTPCYNGSSWIAKPGKSALTADYYVIGSFNSWTLVDNQWAMTRDGETSKYTYNNLVLQADATLKVRAKVTSEMSGWYSAVDYFGENIKAHVDGEGNIVVEEAGTYNVTFYTDGQNGNYVQLAKVVAPAP